MTSDSVSRPEASAGTIFYNAIESLLLEAATSTFFGVGAIDTIDVESTAAGTPVNIKGSTDSGEVDVRSNSSPVDIDINGGRDNVYVGSDGLVSGINALVNVHDSLATGSASLFVQDGSDPTPRVATVEDGSLAGLSPGLIRWTPAPNASVNGGVQELRIAGGSGGNTFDINDTSTFYDYTFLAAAPGRIRSISAARTGELIVQSDEGGTDSVIAGSLSPSLGGTLSNIHGPVYIYDQTQTALTLDDSGDTSTLAKTVTFGFDGTYKTVSGLAPATFDYVPAPSPGAIGVSQLNVFGGRGDEAFDWNSPLLLIPVFIDGGGGTNTLTVDDHAETSAQTYGINSNSVTRTGAAPLGYSNFAALTLYTGSAAT